MVTPIPRRHPWKLARECVSLDLLSDGRLTLGVIVEVPEGRDLLKEVLLFGWEQELEVLPRAGLRWTIRGVLYRPEGVPPGSLAAALYP